MSEAKQSRQWEVEDGLRTLQRAASIQADKKLMGDIKIHHNQVAQVLKTGGVVNKNKPAKVSPSKKK